MPTPVYRSGASLIRQIHHTEVPGDSLAVWHLGQVTLLLKGGGKQVVFDPYLSNHIDEVLDPGGPWKRAFEPPLQPEQVTGANIVIVTHQHGDHLDPVSLRGIRDASPQAVFVCPAPFTGLLLEAGIPEARIAPARAGRTMELEGARIVPVAGKHEEYWLDENGDHGYLGYIVELNGVAFYHAGDTIGFPELADALRPHRIDIAAMPINSRDWRRAGMGIIGNMGHRDAVDLAAEIGVDLLIPVHYDLFPFNADNPAYFVDYLLKEKPDQKFKMMAVGERLLYLKEER